MDLFRIFDKSGRGYVTQEDFAIGIIIKIEELYYNKSLLESMALELLGVEPRCIELATLLEKNNKIKTSKFERNLKAFSFLIKNQIRFIKTEKNLTVLDTVELIKIFEIVLLQVISDIKNFFHISLHKLFFLKLFNSDESNILVNNKNELLFLSSSSAPSSSDSFYEENDESKELNKDNINLISSVKPLNCVWNLSSSSSSYEDTLVTDSAVLGPVNSPTWALNDQNPQGANYNIVNEANLMKHTHSTHMGLNGITSSINSSQLDWNNLLYDLTSNFFNIDWSQLINPENNLSHTKFDKSQLFLLQDIFLAINNFILYRSSIDSNQNLTEKDLLESIEINTTQNNEEIKEKKTKIINNIDVKSRIKEYKKLIQENLDELSTPSLDSLSNASEADATSPSPINPNKKDNEILSIIPPGETETSYNTSEKNSDEFINKNTLYETILSEELFYTQELLQKTQTRLKILELIQSEVLVEECNGNLNINDDGTSEVDSIDNNSINSNYDKKSNKIENLKRFHFKKDKSSIIKRQQKQKEEIKDSNRPDKVEKEDSLVANELILVDEDSDDENKSFEDILKELQFLGATLSERALESSSLGLFLKKDVLLLDNTEEKSSELAISKNITNLLNNMNSSIDFIMKELNENNSIYEEKVNNNKKLLALEELLSEYKIKVEQAELDRNQILALNIELQVLREKNIKLHRDEKKEKDLERINDELLIKNKNLENELNKMIQNLNNFSMISSISLPNSTATFSPTSAPTSGTSSAPNTSNSKIVAYNDGILMSVEEYKKLSESIASLTKKNEELSNELEHVNKENQRIKTGMKVSDQRVKGSLQDQMTLHSQIQTLEEELLIAKTTITKLQRDVEESNQVRILIF